MLTTDQLRSPMTARQWLALHLSQLGSLGFHVGSWAAGAIQRTFLTSFARVGSDMTELVRTFVEFSLNDYSSGDPLAELSDNQFDNQASLAQKTLGPMTLTNVGNSPHTIRPGSVIVTTKTGIQFQNVEWEDSASEKTLAAPGQLVCRFEALKAGTSGNIENGTELTLLTSLAGVTVDNSPPGDDDWFTRSGSEPESTNSLRDRNRTKWATLGIHLIADGYRNIALSVNGVERVALDDQNPRGPGTIDVYVGGTPTPGGALATVGIEQKNTLQGLYAKRVFGAVPTIDDDNWDDSSVQVKDCPTLILQLQGTIYHDANHSSSSVRTSVETALLRYLLALDPGGQDLAPGPSNVIPLGDIYEAIESVRGVRALKLVSPVGDFSVGTTAMVLPPYEWLLEYQPVVSS